VVQRVQIGLQRGFVASLWQCAANLLSLLAIWLATQWQLGLAWLVLALLAAPLFTALVNGLWFFCVAERGLRPSPRVVTAPAVRQLLGTGGQFLVLQLAVAVLVYSDSLVIASVLGASQVATYAVPEKLFSIISVLLATLLIPLWPAYGEAIARRDTAWVKRTLKRSLGMALGVSLLGSLLLVAAGPPLIALWVGPAVEVPMSLLVVLGVWKVLEGAGLALAMFLNGAGIIRLQLFTACLTAAAALVAKPLLVQHLGIVGAPLATVAVYLALTLVPLLLLLPRLGRQLQPPPAGAVT
jgi:O-antigen/teichoic acid export membrane protein